MYTYRNSVKLDFMIKDLFDRISAEEKLLVDGLDDYMRLCSDTGFITNTTPTNDTKNGINWCLFCKNLLSTTSP